MNDDWRPVAAALAAQLTADGDLSPDWREAFERVPRHVFLPGCSLAEAYVNDAVVVQQRSARIVGGGSLELPTSSASQPAVVAAMLARLPDRPGMRVLEIGTGTGYNAALLCHRRGDAHVFSVDIDPQLVDAARDALAGLGHHPTLAAGDGYLGLPAGAPYDAILATCAITHVPPAWIDQLVMGGRIVAPLYGPGCALMVLDKTATDEVTGRFDSYLTGFMPLRDRLDNPLRPGQQLGFRGSHIAHHGSTGVDPAEVASADFDLRLFLHLHLPGLQLGTVDRDGVPTVTVTTLGSHAEAALTPATAGRWPTSQRGEHRPWDTVEHALHRWTLLGRPPRDRFGITALNDAARQYVWLDHPDAPDCWPMPL
jgi:protein-L-isoaspartate(D-aspartate) O-methyltransferase